MPIITSENGTKKVVNKIIHSVDGTKKQIGKIYHSVNGLKTLVYQSREYTKDWTIFECNNINNLHLSAGEKIDSFPKYVEFGGTINSKLGCILDMEVKANDTLIFENIRFNTTDTEQEFNLSIYINDTFINEYSTVGSGNISLFEFKLGVSGSLKITLSCGGGVSTNNVIFSLNTIRLNSYEL